MEEQDVGKKCRAILVKVSGTMSGALTPSRSVYFHDVQDVVSVIVIAGRSY